MQSFSLFPKQKFLPFAFFVLSILGASTSIVAQKLDLRNATAKLKTGMVPSAADFGFKEYTIYDKQDTIHFYTYQKSEKPARSVYLFLPGTDAEDIFTYHRENDNSFWFNSLTDFDFSYLPDDYLFVIVAKPGFGFCGKSKSKNIPEKYWKFTSLADRVYRADKTLQYIIKNVMKNPERLVVFGYSEGFYVASKLATVNKKITHLGIGGGGGYIDFYDFVLFNQKAVSQKEIEIEAALLDNEEIIRSLKEVLANPAPTKFTYGYSNQRWATFSEPPMNNLSRLKIPIYQIHASNDESTPIEDAYLVPLEFARLGKNNLTFTVLRNCNHSFIEMTPTGQEINHKQATMQAFFEWVNQY